MVRENLEGILGNLLNLIEGGGWDRLGWCKSHFSIAWYLPF